MAFSYSGCSLLGVMVKTLTFFRCDFRPCQAPNWLTRNVAHSRLDSALLVAASDIARRDGETVRRVHGSERSEVQYPQADM